MVHKYDINNSSDDAAAGRVMQSYLISPYCKRGLTPDPRLHMSRVLHNVWRLMTRTRHEPGLCLVSLFGPVRACVSESWAPAPCGGRKEHNAKRVTAGHRTIKRVIRSRSRDRSAGKGKNASRRGVCSRTIGQLTIHHSFFFLDLIPLVWCYESPQMRRAGRLGGDDRQL